MIRRLIFNWIHKEKQCSKAVDISFLSDLLIREGVVQVHAIRIASKILERLQ